MSVVEADENKKGCGQAVNELEKNDKEVIVWCLSNKAGRTKAGLSAKKGAGQGCRAACRHGDSVTIATGSARRVNNEAVREALLGERGWHASARSVCVCVCVCA
jgi:hypothetical protein